MSTTEADVSAAPSPAEPIVADAPQFDMDSMSREERQKAMFEGKHPQRLPKPEAKPAEAPPATSAAPAETAPASDTGDEDAPPNETPEQRRKSNKDWRQEVVRVKDDLIASLKSQLEAANRRSAPETPKAEAKATVEDLEDDLDPEKYEGGPAGVKKLFADAIRIAETRALKKFKAEQATEREQQKITEQATTLEQRIANAKKKIPDFEAKVLNKENSPPASNAMLGAIKLREDGLDIAYYLSDHRDEAQRLFQLTAADGPKSEARIDLEFDLIAAKLAKPQEEAPPAPKTITSAPPPPRKISGNGSAAVDPLDAALKAKDWPAYNRILAERKLAALKQ